MRQQHEEEYDPDLDHELDPEGPAGPDIDPEQVQHYVDVLRSRQHLPMAIVGGVLGAALGAAAWLAVTGLTGLPVGWMAVVAGILVGVLVRALGRGIDMSFGIVAVTLTIVCILAGDLLSGCALVAHQSKDAGFLGVIGELEPMQALRLLRDTFNGVDVLFDAMGLAAAFVIGRRCIKARQIVALAAASVEQEAA